MSISKVNSIYESFKKNKITKEKSIILLMEEIFKSPHYYEISKFNEDQRSDFILWSYKGINSLIDNYNDSSSSFLTYFTSTIRFLAKTWKKLYTREKTKQFVLDAFHDEEILEKESKGYIYVSEPAMQYGRKNLYPLNLSPTHKKTLLILALKCYPYLTINHINKIPYLVGISPDEFSKYMGAIEEKTKKNKENFNIADGKLGYTFIKCRQCINELNNMDDNINQYYIVQNDLEKHKKLLEKKRINYYRMKRRIIPKNTTIDAVLNLKQGTSSRLIKRAQSSLFDIKRILDREDT